MYSTNAIVEHLKDQNMDYEFYPTTDEIIQVIKSKLPSYPGSILDVGAGDGRTLLKLCDTEGARDWTKYAIEKNPMLRALISNDIMLVGQDFYENTLWDKDIDVIFCNPPYSEYNEWMFKIISEANAKQIFLVVPKRWTERLNLQSIIIDRGYSVESLGQYSFKEAERAARCTVDVVMLTKNQDWKMQDFFDLELKKQFNIPKKDSNTYRNSEKNERQFKSSVNNHQVVCGGDYVKAIVELYTQEQSRINNTLTALSQIDGELFAELDINLEKIKTLIVTKLSQLHTKYWQEVISKFNVIASRLTSRNSKFLFSNIQKISLCFNEANIHSIAEWVIKTASEKIETQAVEFYNSLITSSNVTLYKSNHRVFVENQFEMKTPSKLNYQIVVSKFNALRKPQYSWDDDGILEHEAFIFLSDLIVVANSLGYTIDNYNLHRLNNSKKWVSGKIEEFHCTRNKEQILLFRVRVFYNGNIHIKMDKGFNHKLNVLKGKHEGWLNSVDDVMNEFDVPEDEAAELFKDLPKLGMQVSGLLN